jgi:hypothetical protein
MPALDCLSFDQFSAGGAFNLIRFRNDGGTFCCQHLPRCRRNAALVLNTDNRICSDAKGNFSELGIYILERRRFREKRGGPRLGGNRS